MPKMAVPMFHVPEVEATVDWYESIGFTAVDTYGNDSDGLSFAVLTFGNSRVMFNQGGKPSTSFRREVDLYVYTDNVDEFFETIKNRVEIIEGPHDTFYGMREVIVRDLNRFWITFGQPSAFQMLIEAVRQADPELVSTAINTGTLKPEALTAALAIASANDYKNPEIAEILKRAGAVATTKVDAAVLRSYVGTYRGEKDFEITVTFDGESLFASPGKQEPLKLLALDQVSFTPAAFDNYGKLIFKVEAGVTIGCILKHGGHEGELKLVT